MVSRAALVARPRQGAHRIVRLPCALIEGIAVPDPVQFGVRPKRALQTAKRTHLAAVLQPKRSRPDWTVAMDSLLAEGVKHASLESFVLLSSYRASSSSLAPRRGS